MTNQGLVYIDPVANQAGFHLETVLFQLETRFLSGLPDRHETKIAAESFGN
jgi:hypothetical protein